jgi:hypothetical protein
VPLDRGDGFLGFLLAFAVVDGDVGARFRQRDGGRSAFQRSPDGLRRSPTRAFLRSARSHARAVARRFGSGTMRAITRPRTVTARGLPGSLGWLSFGIGWKRLQV